MLLKEGNTSHLQRLKSRGNAASPYSNKHLIDMIKRVGQMASTNTPSRIRRTLRRLMDPEVQRRRQQHGRRDEPLEEAAQINVAVGELSSLVKGELKPRTVAARRKQMIEALSQNDEQNLEHGRELEGRLEEERISAEEGETKRSGEEPVIGSRMSYMEETMMKEQVMQDEAQPVVAKTEEVSEQEDEEGSDVPNEDLAQMPNEEGALMKVFKLSEDPSHEEDDFGGGRMSTEARRALEGNIK